MNLFINKLNERLGNRMLIRVVFKFSWNLGNGFLLKTKLF